MRYVLNNEDGQTIVCPICKNIREYSPKNSRFYITCNLKDTEHKKYIEKISLERSKIKSLNKYGVEYASQTDEFKQRSEATNLRKYKTKRFSQTDEFKRLMTSNKEKYDTKRKKTNLKKYGLPFANQNLIIKDNYNMLTSDIIKDNFLNIHNEFILEDFTSHIGCAPSTAYQILKRFEVSFNTKKGSSRAEQEIVSFIRGLDKNIEIIQNSRDIIKPKELDIYLPEYNLAIEYNGLMFHSQGVSKYSIFNTPNKDKNMHLKKTDACEAKGIQLLHINENEWLDPSLKSIWKSVIQNKLKKNKIKIGARECTFAGKIQLMTSKSFLGENHLQGDGAIGKIRYGLIYNNELVSLMTFGKARFSEGNYELIRFANKKGFSVMGAASRLFKAFRKDHSGVVVSYANRRWSNGGLYREMGLSYINTSLPNFYVFHNTNPMKLWHRANFQKHKLINKLKSYNKALTAEQNIFNNGYRKIYDAGNHVFKL